jgi:hypothetical protein
VSGRIMETQVSRHEYNATYFVLCKFSACAFTPITGSVNSEASATSRVRRDPMDSYDGA